MNLLLQSNGWSCLPTSVAMVTGYMPKDITEFLGHDGSEIIWPDLPEPLRRRAFHVEEMIEFCLDHLIYPVQLYKDCCYNAGGTEKLFNPLPDPERINNHIANHDAVLIGTTKNGNRHAVAWECETEKILDPEGHQYSLDQFSIESVLLF